MGDFSPDDIKNLAILGIHMLSMAVWAGGFVFLAMFGKSLADDQYKAALRRVLSAAWAALAILGATGIYLTVYETPTEAPVYSFLKLWIGTKETMAAFAQVPFGTLYAHTLMVKHYLVLASLFLTAWMSWKSSGAKSASPLRLGVKFNLGLACGILLCAVFMLYLHALSFAHVASQNK